MDKKNVFYVWGVESYKARSNNGEEFTLYLVSCLIMDQEHAAERARIEFRKKPHEMTYDEIKRAHELTGEKHNFWSTQRFRIGQFFYEIPEENLESFEFLINSNENLNTSKFDNYLIG